MIKPPVSKESSALLASSLLNLFAGKGKGFIFPEKLFFGRRNTGSSAVIKAGEEKV